MTLIEIMVVITIIGMIASAVGVNVMRSMADSKTEQARADVARLDTIANAYLASHGQARCPGVARLDDVGMLGGTARRDPWEHDYAIDCDGDGAHALSAGPDGQFDTADDVSAATP